MIPYRNILKLRTYMYFLDVVNELSQGGECFSTIKSALICEESHHTHNISRRWTEQTTTTTLVALHSVSENSVNRAPVVSSFNLPNFNGSTAIKCFYCTQFINYYSFLVVKSIILVDLDENSTYLRLFWQCTEAFSLECKWI